MSVHLPAKAFPRQSQEAYFTPASAVWPLLDVIMRVDPLVFRRCQLWEPAAGAGHVARVLGHMGQVFASDKTPDAKPVAPVARLDFLASSGPSGKRPLAMITNPPYGRESREALAFIQHGLSLLAARGGFLALLLPFEFDSRASRNDVVGAHPLFAAKLTLGERVRWVNLPQKASGPMGHHSWFVWSAEGVLLTGLRRDFHVRVV